MTVPSPPQRYVPEKLRKERKSLGRVARAGVMWSYLRVGAGALVAIPTTILLARLLTPDEFGIAAAGVFFGRLAARLANAGMGAALIRLKDLRPDHVSSVFVINLGFGLLGTVLLVGGAPWIGRFYGSHEVASIMPVVALNFLIGVFSTVPQALLARDLRYKQMAVGSSIDVVCTSVMACVLAILGWRYWSLVLGDVVGGAVKWLWAVRIVGWHFRVRFSRDAMRDIQSFALGSFAKRTLEYLTRNIDNVVIGRVLGVTALGFYDKAFMSANKVYNYVTVIAPGVSMRIFSIIQDEPDRFRRAYRKVIMTASLAGYVLFAGLGAVAPNLFVVAFGERWRPAVIPFQVLCLAAMLKLNSEFAGAAALAKGWVWSQVWRQVLQVSLIAVGVYLATPWGINGASAAVLIAAAAFFLSMQSLLRQATGLRWRDMLEPQVPALVCSAGLVTLLVTVEAAVNARGIVHPLVILAAQAVAGTAYCLLFVRLCPFAEVRALIREIVGDFSPALAGALVPDELAGSARAGRSG